MKQQLTAKMALCTFIMMVMAMGTKAQVQVSAGVGGGINYNFHSLSDGEESFHGFGGLVTGQVDLQFSRYAGLLLWIDFYSDLSGKKKMEGGSSIETKLGYLNIAPTLKLCIPGSPFYFYGGPGIAFKTKARLKLTVPYEEEGYRSNVAEEIDIEETNTRFDLRFGLGYDIFASNKLIISPFAGFHYGFNKITKDGEWKINTLNVGIAARFNVN
jgi:hypothetical protein